MTDISRLCMVCLSEKDENGICPRCKKATEVIQKAPCLPLKTIINERYCIGKAIKKNDETITYPAYDLKTNKKVTLREFFPESIAVRGADEVSVLPLGGKEPVFSECYNDFSSLWNKLHRLKGLTSLISVDDVFLANGTIYAVSEESELVTLRDYLLQTKEGFLPWDRARILFMPVLSTLGTLHTSGIIHRGINPSAFVFSKEGRLKLTDFCTERARTSYGEITPELFDGYTPYEQYINTGRTGPWSDIYSFCSVLYRVLIGTTPIDAKTRALNDQMMIPAKFAEILPPYVINAIINGMQIKSSDRTGNIEQLRNDLSASPRAIGASAPVYTEPLRNNSPTSDSIPSDQIGEQNESPTKHISVNTARPAQRPAPAVPSEKENAEKILDEMNKEGNKKKNILIVVLCVVLAILIFAIGFLISAIVNMDKNNNPVETTIEETTIDENIMVVPDFRGMKLEDVLKNPKYSEFFTIQTKQENSAEVENGRIIIQSLPAGTKADKGMPLVLTVSTGQKTVEVPDVTGYSSYEDAKLSLENLGFSCVKSIKQNTTDSTAGKIAETIPPAGTKAKKGDTITIVVYADLEEKTTVPELTENNNSVEEFLSEHQQEQQQEQQPNNQ